MHTATSRGLSYSVDDYLKVSHYCLKSRWFAIQPIQPESVLLCCTAIMILTNSVLLKQNSAQTVCVTTKTVLNIESRDDAYDIRLRL